MKTEKFILCILIIFFSFIVFAFLASCKNTVSGEYLFSVRTTFIVQGVTVVSICSLLVYKLFTDK